MDLFDRREIEPERQTVSVFTRRLKALIEGEVPASWIVGEISNLRLQGSGHLYFALKDAGAQLPVVMFRGEASRLGFAPRDGMEVVVYGQLSVYEPHGRYQLVARSMEESGQGRLHREFERLKRKLFEAGLFNAGRKRALPLLPLEVAVVTSPTGAALQDFLRILKRRGWRGRLRIFPSKVQGTGAAAELVSAIELANRIGGFDALALVRGGGSIEDLWCFNEEVVARAVAASAIPVVSGVGHEIDFTLADLAADVRAETPSAAAELISSAFLVSAERLEQIGLSLKQGLRERVERLQREVANQRARLAAHFPGRALENAFLRMDELETRFESLAGASLRARAMELERARRGLERLDLGGPLRQGRERLERLAQRGERTLDRFAQERRRRVDGLGIKLEALSPKATLGRGFAMLQRADGAPVTSVAATQVGEDLRAVLKDGALRLKVQG